MSLRKTADALAPKIGAPPQFDAFAASLTTKQQRELEDVLADRSLSDRTVARAIDAEHGRRFAEGTIKQARIRRRLR